MRARENKTAATSSAASAATTTTTTTTITTRRLKREQCKRTKHDSAFSDWKILVGPSDWEDYVRGKEGAERYRTQNLPNSASSPGVYELGIVILRSLSQRRERKLDPDFIIPVYLGQADNVRNRLQQYGREGAHLEKVYPDKENKVCHHDFDRRALGLFTDIFSRGYSIVYRWAPIESKRKAEKTEAELLNKFDYAWNKDGNNQRRHNDILKKLDYYSKASQLGLILRKVRVFPQKEKGIKIEGCKNGSSWNASSMYNNLESRGLFSRILKFRRSQPRLVSLRFGVNDDRANICGVALGHGLVCAVTPIEGRKRCAEHKGMKVNGFTSKSSMHRNVGMKNHSISGDPDCDDYHNLHTSGVYISDEDRASVCGFIMDSGFRCTQTPVQGNRRCLEHKGRRIRNCVPHTVLKQKEHGVPDPVIGYMSYHDDQQRGSLNDSSRPQYQALPDGFGLGNDQKVIICGVYLEDGTPCRRSPVVGRKRCEGHKGMRVKTATLRVGVLGS